MTCRSFTHRCRKSRAGVKWRQRHSERISNLIVNLSSNNLRFIPASFAVHLKSYEVKEVLKSFKLAKVITKNNSGGGNCPQNSGKYTGR